MSKRERIILMAVLVSGSLFVPEFAYGRSVFAITKHQESVLTAYNINGEAIEYQIDGAAVPDQASGAVGLALDPDSSTLFVTYEGWAGIEIVNAKTMEYEGNSLGAGDAAVFAGVVFDQAGQKVYAIERGFPNLYVYLWDSKAKRLSPTTDLPRDLDGAGRRVYGERI